MKAIRWKHIACALGIAVYSSQRYGITPFGSIKKHLALKWEIGYESLCTNTKCLGIFRPCQTIIFLSSVYLQLMIEFQPPKILFLLCVCIPNTHSCYQYTRQHAQQSLSPAFRWGPMETVLIISLLLQSTAVCFGIRGFLWRLHMHTHWLQARRREREFFCSINPPTSPLFLLSTQSTHHFPLITTSLPTPDTLASPRSITSPWCNV